MVSSTEFPFVGTNSVSETSASFVPGHSNVTGNNTVTGNSSVVGIPEGCVSIHIFEFIPWDNEDNIVPKEADNIVNFLLLGLCYPLLFMASFITNIINMIVFFKHGLKERINACLFTLSLVDLLGISAAFSYSGDVAYSFLARKGSGLGLAAQFFISNHLVGLSGFMTASQLVYSVIAVERCLCITRPLLVKTFMSTRTTVVALWSLIFVITGCFLLLCAVRFNVMCVFDVRDRSVLLVNYPTEFYYRHQFMMDILYSLLYGLFFPILSFLSVTVCTVVTAVELKKLSKWRETASSASGSVTSRDVAITRVIVGTSILFIVCIIPSVFMRCSFLIVPNLKAGGRYDNLTWVLIRVYLFSLAINNTFNFFIYYTQGSKFRETTNQLFSCCFLCKNTVKQQG